MTGSVSLRGATSRRPTVACPPPHIEGGCSRRTSRFLLLPRPPRSRRCRRLRRSKSSRCSSDRRRLYCLAKSGARCPCLDRASLHFGRRSIGARLAARDPIRPMHLETLRTRCHRAMRALQCVNEWGRWGLSLRTTRFGSCHRSGQRNACSQVDWARPSLWWTRRRAPDRYDLRLRYHRCCPLLHGES